MIPELGHFALIMAFVIAILQSSIPLIGAARQSEPWMAFARPAACLQLGFVALAFSALIAASLMDDFSVLSIVENSHTLKPVLYKIAGVWGNHEGSLVLWVLILDLCGAAVACLGRTVPKTLQARTLAVQAMITSGFLAFILFTSNPFIRLYPAPANGNDLNPLLQDPGLAVHPPCLYLGYVGFSIVFSFAVAALLEGVCDRHWARLVKPWALAAWSALTVGIGLGSWWSYYTLGWGGWWFWDPVENASLMPWLAGTALIHSLIVLEKRDALKSWTILLSILTFSLSLLGTFLVRSGVLTSVHAFASDPTRGIFILILLTLTTGGALTLYGLNAPRFKPGRLFAPLSREGALVLNNLFLVTACATVLTGTLYPLFLNEREGHTVSVGPPYFNMTFIPLMVPLVAMIAIGPALAWKRGDLRGALQRLSFTIVMTLACLVAALWWHGVKPALAPLGMAMAGWAFFSAVAVPLSALRRFPVSPRQTLTQLRLIPRSSWGMSVAHAGLGIAIAGMTGSALWMQDKVMLVHSGETIALAGYEFHFAGAHMAAGPNFTATEGVFDVERGANHITEMHPQRRFYPVQGIFTTYAAIHTNLLSDLYVTIGERDRRDRTAYVARLYVRPLVPWIWIGGALMASGGLVSLTLSTKSRGKPE